MKISADMMTSLATQGGVEKPESSAQAFRDFEALLLGEVMKSAQRPLAGGHILDGGEAGKMYRELFADAVAQQISESGGIGIAARLEGEALGDERE